MGVSLWQVCRGRQYAGEVILSRVLYRVEQEWQNSEGDPTYQCHLCLAAAVLMTLLSEHRRKRVNQ
jgi:hypothetical protein